MATFVYFNFRNSSASGNYPTSKQSGDTINRDVKSSGAGSYSTPADMLPASGSSSVNNNSTAAEPGTNPHYTHMGSWISPPLPAQTLSGTFRVIAALREGSTTVNMTPRVFIYTWKADNTKGYNLFGPSNEGREVGGSSSYPTAQVFYSATSFTSATINEDDRIVIEFETADLNSVTTSTYHGIQYNNASTGSGGGALVFSSITTKTPTSITKDLTYAIPYGQPKNPGFENGDYTAWGVTTLYAATCFVAASAAYSGTYGSYSHICTDAACMEAVTDVSQTVIDSFGEFCHLSVMCKLNHNGNQYQYAALNILVTDNGGYEQSVYQYNNNVGFGWTNLYLTRAQIEAVCSSYGFGSAGKTKITFRSRSYGNCEAGSFDYFWDDLHIKTTTSPVIQMGLTYRIADPDYSTWSYSLPIIVTGSTAKTNFEYRLRVPWQAGMATDFRDIRFTLEDGTHCPYFIESYTTGASAQVWFRAPTSVAINAATIYYGKADVGSFSDGYATFTFFDDFDGNVLNVAKWPYIYTQGVMTYTLANSTLSMSTTQNGYSNYIASTGLTAYAYAGLAKIKLTNGAAFRFIYNGSTSNGLSYDGSTFSSTAGGSGKNCSRTLDVSNYCVLDMAAYTAASARLMYNGATVCTVDQYVDANPHGVAFTCTNTGTNCVQVEWTAERQTTQTEPLCRLTRLTRFLEYRGYLLGTKTKSLTYAITKWPVLVLTYRMVHFGHLVSPRDLDYEINIGSKLTKNVAYFIPVPRIVTKSLTYVINPKTKSIPKALTYMIVEQYSKYWAASKNITLSVATPSTDYQVRVVVYYTAGMKTDFSDVRFSTTGGTNLQFFCGQYVSSNYAVFYVKVPTTSTSSLTVWYNNANAISDWNLGEQTFVFFDHFDGTALDTTKWTQNAIDSLTLSNSTVTYWELGNTGGQFTNLYSNQTWGVGYAVEAKQVAFGMASQYYKYNMGWNTAAESWAYRVCICVPGDSDINQYTSCAYVGANDIDALSLSLLIQSNIPITYTSARHTDNKGYFFCGNNSYAPTVSNAVATTDNLSVVVELESEPEAYPWHTPSIAAFDWIAVRKFVYPEPTAVVVPTITKSLTYITRTVSTVTKNLEYKIVRAVTKTLQYTFPTITLHIGLTYRIDYKTDYPYVKELTITNSAATTNYQYKVNVAIQSGMQSDFRDIRFWDPNGMGCSYYIESYTAGTAATVWVNCAASSATCLFMYYGLSNVSSKSNPDTTFDFWEDFPGSTLDTNKWTQTLNSGTITISGGLATFARGGGTGAGPLLDCKTDVPSNNYIWEARLKFVSGAYYYNQFEIRSQGAVGGGYATTTVNSAALPYKVALLNSSVAWGAAIGTTNYVEGVYSILSSVYDGTLLIGWHNRKDKTTWARSTTYAKHGSVQLYISSSSGASVAVDWVLQRKYVAVEPTLGFAIKTTKSLAYEVHGFLGGTTKQLTYAIQAPKQITKSLQYLFPGTARVIQKDLTYDIETQSDFSYVKELKITNSAATANYQYRVNVGIQTGMQTDFRDIRFWDSSNNSCSYWIEDYTAGTSATVWVKCVASSATCLYMYYGNATVASKSNPNTTFDFFDHFLGSAVDATKWTTTLQGGGTVSVSGSEVFIAISGASQYPNLLCKTDVVAPNLIWESKVRKSAGVGTLAYFIQFVQYSAWNVGLTIATDGNSNLGQAWLLNHGVVWDSVKVANYSQTGTILSVAYDGANLIGWVDRASKRSWARSSYGNVHAGIENYYVAGAVTYAVDWVLQRKYVATQPTIETPTKVTKSLTYEITTAMTRSLTYCMQAPKTVTKNLQYCFRLSVPVTKSLAYGIDNYSAYSYSVNISITGAATLNNYQHYFYVPYRTGMQTDFRDIRFAQLDGTPCRYWIEGYTASTAASVWIKVPSANQTSITMYYGSATVASASNGDATFLIFDHFDGSTGIDPNTSKWTKNTLNGAPVVDLDGSSSLRMKLNLGTHSGAGVVSNSTLGYTGDVAVEAMIKRVTGNVEGAPGTFVGVTDKTSRDATYYGNYADEADGRLVVVNSSSYRLGALFQDKVTYGTQGTTDAFFNVWVRTSVAIKTSTKTTTARFIYLNTDKSYTTAVGTNQVDPLYVFVHYGDYNVINNYGYCDWIATRLYLAATPTLVVSPIVTKSLTYELYATRVEKTLAYTIGGSTTISVTDTAATANYQYRVAVTYQPGMATDFSTIRVKQIDGTNCPYWIQDYTTGIAATVWFKAPSASQTSFTLSWLSSNSSAASGDDVFLLYDHFAGTVLDTGKWNVNDASGNMTYSLSDSKLTMSINGAYYNWIRGTLTGIVKISTMAYMKITGSLGTTGLAVDGLGGAPHDYITYNGVDILTIINGSGEQNPYTYDVASAYNVIELARYTSSLTRLYINGSLKDSSTATNTPLSDLSSNFSLNGATTNGVYVEWVALRQCTETEPTCVMPTTRYVTKSLEYKIGTVVLKSLTYVIVPTTWIGKFLTYSIHPVVTFDKSLRYYVYAAKLKQKGLAYAICKITVSSSGGGYGLPFNIRYQAVYTVNTFERTPYLCSWQFSNGTTTPSGGLVAVLPCNVAGTYSATVTALPGPLSTTGPSATSAATTVSAQLLPNVDFYSPTLYGASTVQFTSLSAATDGNGLTYLWTFGDGATSNVENPVHTYSAPSSYTVTLTVTGTGGQSVKTKSNYITEYPEPPEAEFTVKSGGTIVSTQTPVTYTVTLTVITRAGLSDSVSHYVKTTFGVGFVEFQDLSVGHDIVQWIWDYGYEPNHPVG